MDEELRNRYRRDFTKEIIRPPRPPQRGPVPAPVHAQAHPAHSGSPHQRPARRSKRRRFRRLMIAIALLALIGCAGAGGYWYWSSKLKSPIPTSTQASVNFPLLYPVKLPSGFRLDESSFDTSGNVVVYTADNSSGAKIAFTDQQRPATFNFNSFYKSLGNSSSFDTTVGQAAIGTTNGRLLGSLVTNQSWLLVSSPSQSIRSNDLKLILSNLKQSAR